MLARALRPTTHHKGEHQRTTTTNNTPKREHNTQNGARRENTTSNNNTRRAERREVRAQKHAKGSSVSLFWTSVFDPYTAKVPLLDHPKRHRFRTLLESSLAGIGHFLGVCPSRRTHLNSLKLYLVFGGGFRVSFRVISECAFVSFRR